ncbi:acyltransferase ChoActase/COT/CPT [Chytriomyces sp. MP71]|nr:acyltransferase ChoActase/COT/CPT [Chytriomyces sp. MP71]
MAAATFSLQGTLPRLPIPSIKETCELYLRSIKPHAASDEEFAKAEAAVLAFAKPGGAGELLQKRLLEYDSTQPMSWLSRWWLTLAYHSWRESVLINSNWYIMFREEDDPAIINATSPHSYGKFTPFQVKRAAKLAAGYLNYKDRLDRELIPVEATKAGPLCMNQYRCLFGVTRVPKKDCDMNVGSHPCQSKHIVVVVREQFYVVQVYSDGKRLSADAIERQLWAVLADVTNASNKMQPPIGLLTAEHRDTWATEHEYLERLSPENENSFRLIETALFNISLDEFVVGPLNPSRDVLAKYLFHNFNGSNRWFDKSISICVSADGNAGCNGEHSPLDALVAAYGLENAVFFKETRMSSGDEQVAPIKRITWVADSKVEEFLAKARVFIKNLIADSDVKLHDCKALGSDFIKKQVGASPDAVVQMALQVTYYRIHKRLPGVYETASTRKYLFGRTETCRSLSSASAAFVRGFEDPSLPPALKLDLLRAACKSHVEYIGKASNGFGVDRHLLGLRLVAKPGETFEIFTDPLFARSQHWDLSTSALNSTKNMLGSGFGTVYPDGYGMNYQIHVNNVTIAVESKVSDKATCSKRFCETLDQVLKDIHATTVASKAAKL